MEPIIDPKLFYWADICESLNGVFIILLIISIVALIILAAFFNDVGECFDENDSKFFKRCLTITLILLSISTLGIIFVPSRKTICQMIVFNNITENNIQAGKENIKELIDYTIDKIDEVNKEE